MQVEATTTAVFNLENNDEDAPSVRILLVEDSVTGKVSVGLLILNFGPTLAIEVAEG